MDRPFQFSLRTLLILIAVSALLLALALAVWKLPPAGPFVVSAAVAFSLASISFVWNYCSIRRLEDKTKPKTTGWHRLLCIVGATGGLVLMFGFAFIGMAILYALLMHLNHPAN